MTVKRSLVLVSLALMACSENGGGDATADPASNGAEVKPGAAEIRFAQIATPADAALSAKYDRSCRSCHALPDSGAPLTGHQAAWDNRLSAKTMDGLVAITRTGLAAMPPMGLCNDCSDADFVALIDFMAGGEI